ncbi:hypothetical protein FHG66_21335 [Rubellimicrobium rubrum]|uniref:Uncharacterized protein n=1 Tax=Rubellimicrobium rubrum TaxID=2585369 RepID=A0A5C4MI49_9RHOB|nr:hypothetical protein [Rubellimicrobium rubrum]TNC42530.1 hypothetical protein FHG66_21335 [Rubellimicrobium rubrum]
MVAFFGWLHKQQLRLKTALREKLNCPPGEMLGTPKVHCTKTCKPKAGKATIEELVDDSKELLALLANRGVPVGNKIVEAVIDAEAAQRAMVQAQSLKEGSGQNEEGLNAKLIHDLVQGHALLVKAAHPASLASLRYMRHGRKASSGMGYMLFACLILVVLIVIQTWSVRLTDVAQKVGVSYAILDASETADADRDGVEQRIAAELLRVEGGWLMGVTDGLEPEAAHRITFGKVQGLANTLNSLVLPALYGLLGGIAYILRSYPLAVQAGTLVGEYTGENFLRMTLAMLSGVIVGLYVGPEAAVTGLPNEPLTTLTLTPIALAFLVGYSVDFLFGFLDRIVMPPASQTSAASVTANQAPDVFVNVRTDRDPPPNDNSGSSSSKRSADNQGNDAAKDNVQ